MALAYIGGLGLSETFADYNFLFNGNPLPSGKGIHFVNTYGGATYSFDVKDAQSQPVSLKYSGNYCKCDFKLTNAVSSSTSFTIGSPQFASVSEYATDTISGVTHKYRFFANIVGLYLGREYTFGSTTTRYWQNLITVCCPDRDLYVHLHDATAGTDEQGKITQYNNCACVNLYNNGNTGSTDFKNRVIVVRKACYVEDFSKVAFDPNGGSWKLGSTIQNPRPCFVGDPVGELPTYNDVLKQGQILQGWYVGQTKVDANTTVTTGDHTLVAHWQDPYYVYLNSHGGYLPEEDRVKEVFEGFPYGALKPLPTPVRSGYVFRGWYTQETGGERIIDTTPVEPLTDDSSNDS